MIEICKQINELIAMKNKYFNIGFNLEDLRSDDTIHIATIMVNSKRIVQIDINNISSVDTGFNGSQFLRFST